MMQPGASACSSPLVIRRHGSVSRESSVDPSDPGSYYTSGNDDYAFEKDRVIGELAKRMKKKVPPGKINKNKRGRSTALAPYDR